MANDHSNQNEFLIELDRNLYKAVMSTYGLTTLDFRLVCVAANRCHGIFTSPSWVLSVTDASSQHAEPNQKMLVMGLFALRPYMAMPRLQGRLKLVASFCRHKPWHESIQKLYHHLMEHWSNLLIGIGKLDMWNVDVDDSGF